MSANRLTKADTDEIMLSMERRICERYGTDLSLESQYPSFTRNDPYRSESSVISGDSSFSLSERGSILAGGPLDVSTTTEGSKKTATTPRKEESGNP